MHKLNVIDMAISTGKFQTFTRLVEGSVLEEKLRSPDPFTLFAPVDIAFADLSPSTFSHLLLAENQGVLADVLGYHAIPGKVLSHELRSLRKAPTLYGTELTIDGTENLTIDGANLLHFDIVAANGVIHGIDRLLMPSRSAAAASG